MLLISLAVMAEGFDCMEVIAHATKHTGIIPEQLRSYVQPRDIVSVDGAIRVRLIDALFVDRAVAAAWTVENIGDEPLYIRDKKLIGGKTITEYTYYSSVGILQPGETRYCGFAGYLANWIASDLKGTTQPLTITIAGMKLLGESVDWDEIAGVELRETDSSTRDREVDRLFDEENKIVFDHDGSLLIGVWDEKYYYDSKSLVPSAAQIDIQSGKVELHSLVHMKTQLKNDVTAYSVMPVEEATAIVSGGVMHMTRAELSPAQLIVEATFTFPDEATALAFYDGDRMTDLPVAVVDSHGKRNFSGKRSEGFVDDMSRMTEPKRQTDGTYIWLYRVEHWYFVPESDPYYLLLITGRPENKANTSDFSYDYSNAIRFGGIK
jgi:hypothetical protein